MCAGVEKPPAFRSRPLLWASQSLGRHLGTAHRTEPRAGGQPRVNPQQEALSALQRPLAAENREGLHRETELHVSPRVT